MKVEIELNDLIELVHSNNKDITFWEGHSSSINEYKIEKRIKRKIVEDNPHVKMKLIHHGGCLSCYQPQQHGLGFCLNCQYCSGNTWDKPDLSK